MSTEKPKMTLIGAGSTIFGPACILSILQTKSLEESTLSLVDKNAEKLELISNAAKEMNNHLQAGVKIEAHTEREKALPGTDYLLVTAEEDRIGRWKLDWQIPQEFGIELTLGENRGPSGLSHTLRTVPLVLDMCRDAEKICPDATAIIFTNPEDRITYAVNKYTEIEAVGYCDGNWDFRDHFLGDLLDLPGENIYMEGAGINHMVWITELRNKKNGRDLYPKLVKRAKERNWQPLSQHLYQTYGLWPYENDEHVGEYLGYACEFIDCDGYNFDAHQKREQKWSDRISKLVGSNYPKGKFINELGEWVWHVLGDSSFTKIIEGEYFGKGMFFSGANIMNENKVSNLPDDMVVEVPAMVNFSGVNGLNFGKLPDSIANICAREGTIQKLSAEAAVEGSREKAIRALDLDDIVKSPEAAEKILNKFLEVHQAYLPTF